ncbi:NAD(P)/FAD-dependent oxidoreductase [Candidatus Woesearchaeota archaeon]|nr:NAD(P)/FAD-dependent oxidoreductase [Candidatus Woesearchaeota archaeon]
MNIAIIGAGPIGGYAAYLLAKAGHSVELYEEHAQVGCPIQCTGLLTHDFDQFNLPKDSFLVNTFRKCTVSSPHFSTTINQKEYLVSRPKFDWFFVELAMKEGAQLHLNHSFLRKEGKNLVIRDSAHKTEKIISPDIVIAADGPLSKTAKAYGMFHPTRTNYIGIQATVEGKFDPGGYEAYFGKEICPGLFAWIVPESATIARVGVATMKNTKHYFDTFMQQKGFTVKELQAGTIPVYCSEQVLQKENCYVLGDAAGFVKATTLGGLVPGLKQAEAVAKSILEGKDLEKEVKPVRTRLWLHLKLRNLLDKFSDEDFDKMVKYMDQPRIRAILEQHTRENPWPIVLKTLFREPRFLYFMRYLVLDIGHFLP